MPDIVFIRRPWRCDMHSGKKTPMWRGGMLAMGSMLLVAAWLAIGDAPADDAAQVITDTPDYCAQLRAEVQEEMNVAATAKPAANPEARAPILAKVDSLAEEGGRLCAAGKVRGGIIRLRRALTLMHEPPPHGGE